MAILRAKILLSSSMLPRLKGLQVCSVFINCPILFENQFASELTDTEREREMRDTSKVIMGATLVMIVSIAILLGLVLILLAELYCSLLFRRRRKPGISTSTLPLPNVAAAIAATSERHGQEYSRTPTLSNFYAQGVLNAPRNLLFPSAQHSNANVGLEKKQHSGLCEFSGSPAARQSAFSPSSPSLVHLAPPKLVYEVPDHHGAGFDKDGGICGSSSKETYIYICNPIYDNDANSGPGGRVDTPFETPDSSPSRLEGANGFSGGNDDMDDVQSPNSITSPSSPPPVTPPLTPMKKLPAEAISITLRDAGSLATSGSESNSNNEGISSTLSSGTPCTSPSW